MPPTIKELCKEKLARKGEKFMKISELKTIEVPKPKVIFQTHRGALYPEASTCLVFCIINEEGESDAIAWYRDSEQIAKCRYGSFEVVYEAFDIKNNIKVREKISHLLNYIFSAECISDLQSYIKELEPTKSSSTLDGMAWSTAKQLWRTLGRSKYGDKVSSLILSDIDLPDIPLVKEMTYDNLISHVELAEAYQKQMLELCKHQKQIEET